MEQLLQPLFDYLKNKKFFWLFKPLFFAVSLIVLFSNLTDLLRGL